MIFRSEQQTLNALKDLHSTAFFCVGGLESDKDMVKDLRSFVEQLRAHKFPHFQMQLWVPDGETHHSVFPGAAMRGLRFIFASK